MPHMSELPLFRLFGSMVYPPSALKLAEMICVVHFAVGATWSTTLKKQMAALLFLPSEAVSVTECGPVSLHVKLRAGLVSTRLQLSVELPLPMLAGKKPVPLVPINTTGMGDGHLAMGAMLSTTVTVAEQVLVLPWPSFTVRVTEWEPMFAQPKAPGTTLTRLTVPQLSFPA